MLIQRDLVVVIYPHEPRFAEIAAWCDDSAQLFRLDEGGRLYVMDDQTFDRFAIVFNLGDREGKPLNSAKFRRRRS